jgi:Family of unknown function (DUF6448)
MARCPTLAKEARHETHLACLLAVIIAAPAAFAHCDWIKGTVVADARAALAKGDVAPVLKWVTAADEPEICRAFARTLTARAVGEDARDVADQWFVETLVRVHRASEGEPFKGLKAAHYGPEAGIEMADHALETSSVADVEQSLTTAMKSETAEAVRRGGRGEQARRRERRGGAAVRARVHGVHSLRGGGTSQRGCAGTCCRTSPMIGGNDCRR